RTARELHAVAGRHVLAALGSRPGMLRVARGAPRGRVALELERAQPRTDVAERGAVERRLEHDVALGHRGRRRRARGRGRRGRGGSTRGGGGQGARGRGLRRRRREALWLWGVAGAQRGGNRATEEGTARGQGGRPVPCE